MSKIERYLIKFKATVRKTQNMHITNLYIEEVMFDDDDDGYVQIYGETFQHCLEIEGHNSYERAKMLADQINGRN